MFEHQDWNTVVLKKKLAQPEKALVNKTSHATVSSATNKPAWKIEQQVDGESGKPIVYVSREDAQKIIGGRVGKKMTQKDLANRLNMQVKDIQDIETCKAVENKAVLAKIKRFLQVT